MKVVCMPSLVWMCIRPNAARSVCGAHCLRRCRGWNCSGHLRFVTEPRRPYPVKSSRGSVLLWFPLSDERSAKSYQKGARSGTRASAP